MSRHERIFVERVLELYDVDLDFDYKILRYDDSISISNADYNPYSSIFTIYRKCYNHVRYYNVNPDDYPIVPDIVRIFINHWIEFIGFTNSISSVALRDCENGMRSLYVVSDNHLYSVIDVNSYIPIHSEFINYKW